MKRWRTDITATAGFTLVELVVVLMVLGIVAAVALPKFFDLDDFRSRGYYDEVAGAVRYAQKLAVASGYDVQVNIAGGRYVVKKCSVPSSGICPSGIFTTIIDEPVDVTPFNSVPSTFFFDAMGRYVIVPPDNEVTVTVGGRTFTVVAETGYVDANAP